MFNELKQKISEINLTEIAVSCTNPYKIFLQCDAGVEHHKLIAYMSQFFPGQCIFDIGTHLGASALAMSYGGTNVVSYDISNILSVTNPPSNIEFRIGDFRQDPRVLKSPFILIDVDPHDGVQEQAFHEFFLKNNYKGIVLWDDIHLNEGMRAWWASIDVTKCIKADLTSVGHSTGTGLIVY
jgi:hypothetical protein